MLLRKHFASFGPIDYFTLHLKLSYCYGFIQYKSVYSAAAALHNQHHFVAGYKIKVSVADSWHQPPTKIEHDPQTNVAASCSNQSDNNDLVNILDLNDDCLWHIFNLLNCIDLSAVDQTCVRFQRVAGDVFRKKHTAVNLTMTDLPSWSNVSTNQLTLQQTRSLIMSYGSHIQKLQVAAVSFKQENRYRVLDLIIRSCTSLRTLCLTGFYIKVI